MDQYAKLQTLLQRVCQAKQNPAPLLFQAQVESIEKDCCTINIAGLRLSEVRLKSIADGQDKKVCLVIPSVGSKILVGSLTGDYRDLAVLSIETFDKIILGGDEFGGMVKASVLTQKLNALEKEINDLKTVFAGWTPVAQDGGTALKSAVSPWAGASLQTTTQTDIENDKILQG